MPPEAYFNEFRMFRIIFDYENAIRLNHTNPSRALDMNYALGYFYLPLTDHLTVKFLAQIIDKNGQAFISGND
jgi:hypothetical protein